MKKVLTVLVVAFLVSCDMATVKNEIEFNVENKSIYNVTSVKVFESETGEELSFHYKGGSTLSFSILRPSQGRYLVFEGFEEGRDYKIVFTIEGGYLTSTIEFVYTDQDTARVEITNFSVLCWGL